MKKKNLLITMSGGTTTVINSTLAGLIKEARCTSLIDRIYAGIPGLKGVMNEDIVDLTNLSETELEKLKKTPGSGFIGTTRIRPLSNIELNRIKEVFDVHSIGFYINIGGNGTIKQSKQIASAIDTTKTYALPKTVDNDLGDDQFEQVFFTPGFPSCVNYWKHKLDLLNQESLGSHSHDRVLVAQTFGRKTGFITGSSRFGDINRELPLMLLLPEDQQPIDSVLNYIENTLIKFSRAIIILSEGYEIGEIGESYDLSGQIMYGSSETTSAQLLVNQCMENGIQARGFIPTVDQRLEISFSTRLDLYFAYQLGIKTIEAISDQNTNIFLSIMRSKDNKPFIDYIDLNQISDFSRAMPDEWVIKNSFDVSDQYIDYLSSIFLNDKEYSKLNNKFHFQMPIKNNIEKKLQKWAFDDYD